MLRAEVGVELSVARLGDVPDFEAQAGSRRFMTWFRMVLASHIAPQTKEMKTYSRFRAAFWVTMSVPRLDTTSCTGIRWFIQHDAIVYPEEPIAVLSGVEMCTEERGRRCVFGSPLPDANSDWNWYSEVRFQRFQRLLCHLPAPCTYRRERLAMNEQQRRSGLGAWAIMIKFKSDPTHGKFVLSPSVNHFATFSA